jgi:hypothetical protein
MRGFLRANARRIPRYFLPAYQWLIAQMHQRVHGYSGGAPVRIEPELPREGVLLLDGCRACASDEGFPTAEIDATHHLHPRPESRR